MKVLILGADGYLGWPAAMYLSRRGHDVFGVDSGFKRVAVSELGCAPLVASPGLRERAELWQENSGAGITVREGDVTDYGFLKEVFRESRPEVLIHLAEQPSAPYSMMDQEKALFTVRNNLLSTLNVAYAVRELNPDCHIIKLGTMGEYGTPDIDIEEGWLEVAHRGRKETFLFPRQAGSLYHTTKIQDTDLLWFYVRTWGLRVTDLMQGPVYGFATEESAADPGLLTGFHYDEIFGTVLNRFVVQAVAGHPLTVYGKGGQSRGYLNLVDSMQCLGLAARQPAEKGELRIFNQITETFTVLQLAGMVERVGARLGYRVRTDFMENPRVEMEDHYYNPRYSGLLDLGLQPHLLTDEILEGFFGLVREHEKQIDPSIFVRGVTWK